MAGWLSGLFGGKRRDHATVQSGPVAAPAELEDEVASVARDMSLEPMIAPSGILVQNLELIRKIASKAGGGDVADYWALYRRMRTTDLKFKSLVQVRKNGVLSRESGVIPSDFDPDPDRAALVADAVKAALANVPDFRDDLRQLLDAIPVGFAVSEVVWEQKALAMGDGELTMWVPSRLLQRRNGRFGFKPTGELMYSPEPDKFEDVPPYKFVVMRHSPECEDPYGLSEAGEVVWWWFFKHLDVRWWMVFAEKFGMPTALGRHKPGATQEQREALLTALRRIQSEYGVTIPDTMTVEFLEASRTGSIDTYDRFVEYCDRQMAEALTGQSLATGQGTMGTGSYAQAEVHQGVRQEFIEADSLELMGAINGQLVRWIVDLNFGPEVPAPSWQIDYESVDLKGDLDIDGRLVDFGVPLSVDYFYEKYKRPQPDEGAELVTRPSAPAGGGGLFGFSRGGARGRVRTHAAVSKGARAAAARRQEEVARLAVRLAVAGSSAWGLFRGNLEAAMGQADRISELYGLARVAATDEVRERLVGALALAKVAGFASGGLHVLRDFVWPERERERGKAAFAAAEGPQADDFDPNDDGLEWFEGLTPWSAEALAGLAQEARLRAITIAGAETDKQVARVQALIAEYMRQGKTLADFQGDFARLWGEMGLEGKRPHEVENLFRSEVMRAYGAGRTMALRSDEARDAFPMWQYIAVRDDRTRPEHEALHGVVLPADDPFWYTHTPPWDYQCRCDVVPVSRREIEEKGVEATGDVTLPDGTVVSVSQIPGAGSGFRGIGF